MISNFASINWQSFHDWKLCVEWNVLIWNSFFEGFKFQIKFLEFMRKKFRGFDESSMAGLTKLHSPCPEQCFLESSFVAKFVFIYSFFDFQEKNSDFRKRFLSGFLEKNSTSPDGQCLEKSFFLNIFKFLLLHHFRTLSGKKLNFRRWIIGNVKEFNLVVQRNDFMKTIVFWKK